MQERALHHGWKVRRNTLMKCHEVPFFNYPLRIWVLPNVSGNAIVVSETLALELIEAAGGYTQKGGQGGGLVQDR
jgi:hypothetical protein